MVSPSLSPQNARSTLELFKKGLKTPYYAATWPNKAPFALLGLARHLPEGWIRRGALICSTSFLLGRGLHVINHWGRDLQLSQYYDGKYRVEISWFSARQNLNGIFVSNIGSAFLTMLLQQRVLFHMLSCYHGWKIACL